jgi:uncharacterized protein YhhL (DUF1145 family)
MKFDLPKILLSIVWLLIFAGLLGLLPEKYAHPLQFLGGLLTVAHLIEYVIFYVMRFQSAGRQAAHAPSILEESG